MLRFFLVALSFAASSAVVAQPIIGVRGGLNVAWWDLDEDPDLDGTQRLWFAGGLTGRFEIGGPVDAQLEALYVQKGTAIADGTVRYRADYLEVPVLATVAFPFGSQLRASFEAGAAVAFPLRGRFSADPPEPVEGQPDFDPDDLVLEGDLNLQTDVGLVVGAQIGRGPVGLGVRYTHGLRNVIELEPESCSPAATECSVVPWKSRALAVTASVRVP